jgi:hypothetical protein
MPKVVIPTLQPISQKALTYLRTLFNEILAFRELDAHIVCRRVGKKRVSEVADFVLVGKQYNYPLLAIKFVRPIRQDWGFWNDIRTMYPLVRYCKRQGIKYVGMCDFIDVIGLKLDLREDFTFLGEAFTFDELTKLYKNPQDFADKLYRVIWHYATVAKKIAIEYNFFRLPEYILLPQELPVTTVPQAPPCSLQTLHKIVVQKQ